MTRLIYWGHHKCASSWISMILHTVSWHAGWTIGKHEPLYAPHDIRSVLDKDVVVCPTAKTTDADIAGKAPGIHVIRDPRDVITSAYFSHLATHPTDKWPGLEQQRQRLKRINKEQGLIATMDFIDDTLQEIKHWDYTRPHIIELKMEDITQRPYQAMLNIFHGLDLLSDPATTDPVAQILTKIKAKTTGLTQYPASWLLRDVHQHNYKRLSNGRQPGEESRTSHYRKGTPGDWRHHWTDEIQRQYHYRHHRLHEALGYNDDW